MDVVLLHNENAGDESWSRHDVEKLVRRAGFKPRYYPIGVALDEPKILERGEFVIVAGGDGAIRKAALALLARPGRHALAPLPLGTANNIARSFGMPSKPARVVDGWRHATRRAFDAGLIEGPWGRRHFIEGVGVGLLSRAMTLLHGIDEDTRNQPQKAKHKLHRDLCVAAALAQEMRPLPARLTLNGRTAVDEFLLLEILNIRHAGPGLELAPKASPSDGRLDVVSATARQRPRLWKTLRDRLRGEPGRPWLHSRRVREATLRVDASCRLRIDDETVAVRAGTVVHATLEPARLEVVLPGGGDKK